MPAEFSIEVAGEKIPLSPEQVKQIQAKKEEFGKRRAGFTSKRDLFSFFANPDADLPARQVQSTA